MVPDSGAQVRTLSVVLLRSVKQPAVARRRRMHVRRRTAGGHNLGFAFVCEGSVASNQVSGEHILLAAFHDVQLSASVLYNDIAEVHLSMTCSTKNQTVVRRLRATGRERDYVMHLAVPALAAFS
jgi:hypothetical protein